MTNMIARHHLLMSRDTFIHKRKIGQFNGFYKTLSYVQTDLSVPKFLTLLEKVGSPWSWDNIEKYKDHDYLAKHFTQDETKLFYLLDNYKIIGYALTTRPSKKELSEFSAYLSHEDQVIEIENLGLFPDQAGNGRGAKFFEMIMSDLFKSNDYVYWSMSSTNHPRLFDYYTKKIGMQHIGTNYAPDPRPITHPLQAA